MSLEYKYPFGKNGQYCNPAEFASAVFFKNENPRISFHWINNAFVENLFGRIPLDFRVFLKIRWIVFECRTRFSKIQRILIFFEWNFFFQSAGFGKSVKKPNIWNPADLAFSSPKYYNPGEFHFLRFLPNGEKNQIQRNVFQRNLLVFFPKSAGFTATERARFYSLCSPYFRTDKFYRVFSWLLNLSVHFCGNQKMVE